MALKESLARLKNLIFTQTEIHEQQRLIASIIDELDEESVRTAELVRKYKDLEETHSQLQKAHLELQMAQTKKPPEFIFHNGVKWKRTGDGFEQFPYCADCAVPTVMTPVHRANRWICSNGHQAPLTGPPRQ